MMRRGLGESDPFMSPAQLRILEFLQAVPGASLSELSERLEITNATASSHVDRLVKRGLAERVEDPDERRRVVLTLTKEGTKVLESMRTVLRKLFAQVLAPLSVSQIERIHDGLSVLDAAIKQFHVTHTKNPDEV